MVYTTLLTRFFEAFYGPAPAPPAEDAAEGLALVADGVGGLHLCGTGLNYAAAAAGRTLLVHTFDWGHGFGRWHADLTNVANHEAQAEAIAAEVEGYRRRNPGRPVFLVGKSGGTGVVVKVLERLATESVARVVLLAPALSPTYDLSRALRAVRDELVVFWSPLDVVVLGAGTRLFGTVDRVPAVSAGLVGFRTPGEADPGLYAKVRQVRWSPEMIPSGYLGGHVGPDHPAFLRKYVVPLLTVVPAEAPSASVGREATGC